MNPRSLPVGPVFLPVGDDLHGRSVDGKVAGWEQRRLGR
jgi:hypothetical protein